MSETKGFPKHYQEMYKGWTNELKQSGWGEKFIEAKKSGISQELILEYQMEYVRELMEDYRPEKVKTIRELLDYVTEMVETNADDERVLHMIEGGVTTPGMWAYITSL